MAQCVTPFNKYDEKAGKYLPFPCGKCPICLKRRISGWSFRLVKEYENSQSANWVTFTYNTNHVPITINGFMTLKKRDIQLFFKRLRKLHTPVYKTKIKYYVAGEYGTDRMRPHYHALIFNADILQIEQAWRLGEIYNGPVNELTTGYTLKYMSKNGVIPIHKNDDRQKEFSLMSKGIGKSYLTASMVTYHKQDLYNRFYVTTKGGVKIALPRYYKKKIYTKNELVKIGTHISNLTEIENDKNQEINIWKYEQDRLTFANRIFQNKNTIQRIKEKL